MGVQARSDNSELSRPAGAEGVHKDHYDGGFILAGKIIAISSMHISWHINVAYYQWMAEVGEIVTCMLCIYCAVTSCTCVQYSPCVWIKQVHTHISRSWNSTCVFHEIELNSRGRDGPDRMHVS